MEGEIGILTFLRHEDGSWRYRLHDTRGQILRESDDTYDLPTAIELAVSDIMVLTSTPQNEARDHAKLRRRKQQR